MNDYLTIRPVGEYGIGEIDPMWSDEAVQIVMEDNGRDEIVIKTNDGKRFMIWGDSLYTVDVFPSDNDKFGYVNLIGTKSSNAYFTDGGEVLYSDDEWSKERRSSVGTGVGMGSGFVGCVALSLAGPDGALLAILLSPTLVFGLGVLGQKIAEPDEHYQSAIRELFTKELPVR